MNKMLLKLGAAYLVIFIGLVLLVGAVVEEMKEKGLKNIAEEMWYGESGKKK